MDPAGALFTAAGAADGLCPKDARDFMDLIDFMDFTDLMDYTAI